MGHLPRDVGYAVLHAVFDDDPNVQLWPDLQTRPPAPGSCFDLLAKGASDAAGIGRPAIGTDQQRTQALPTGPHLPQQPIRQPTVACRTDHSCQKQPRGDHQRQPHPDDLPASFDADLVGLDMS